LPVVGGLAPGFPTLSPLRIMFLTAIVMVVCVVCVCVVCTRVCVFGCVRCVCVFLDCYCVVVCVVCVCCVYVSVLCVYMSARACVCLQTAWVWHHWAFFRAESYFGIFWEVLHVISHVMCANSPHSGSSQVVGRPALAHPLYEHLMVLGRWVGQNRLLVLSIPKELSSTPVATVASMLLKQKWCIFFSQSSSEQLVAVVPPALHAGQAHLTFCSPAGAVDDSEDEEDVDGLDG
jgi:hypothetical protein